MAYKNILDRKWMKARKSLFLAYSKSVDQSQECEPVARLRCSLTVRMRDYISTKAQIVHIRNVYYDCNLEMQTDPEQTILSRTHCSQFFARTTGNFLLYRYFKISGIIKELLCLMLQSSPSVVFLIYMRIDVCWLAWSEARVLASSWEFSSSIYVE